MKSVILTTLICLSALSISPTVNSDTRFSLPRATQGIEVLLGVGVSYDETAFIGEETTIEATPSIAIMTDKFYLDIHQIAYRESLRNNVDIKIFGTQDGLPSADEGEDLLNIKSGDSFDLGLLVEKKLGSIRVGTLLAADVSGTHNGYMVELSAGKDYTSVRSKFGFTIGGRYQDSERSNYYFGVSKDEVIVNAPEFSVDDTVTAFASAIYTYQLTQNIGLWADASITSLSNQAKHSPRIADSASVEEIEALVGLFWQFSVYSP